jgi:hypothetical protein
MPGLSSWDDKCVDCYSSSGKPECQDADLLLSLEAHQSMFSLSSSKFYSATLTKKIDYEKPVTSALECGKIGSTVDDGTILGEFEKYVGGTSEASTKNEVAWAPRERSKRKRRRCSRASKRAQEREVFARERSGRKRGRLFGRSPTTPARSARTKE